MRDMIADLQVINPPGTVFTMAFPAGKTFMYTNNRWTWGIRNLRMLGNGARFQNTAAFATVGGGGAYALIVNRSIFEVQDVTAPLKLAKSAQTSLIAMVAAGSQTVRLLSPAEAVNFPAGMRAVIYSYEQLLSGGYPPDARYFDYAKVVSADPATGIVTLDTPLARSHSADFPEAAGAICGRARIFALDGCSPVAWGDTLYAENMTFLDNPNARRPGDGPGDNDPLFKSHQYFDIAGYASVQLKNITGSNIAVGCVGTYVAQDCTLFDCTLDKFVTLAAITGGSISNSLSEGTGVDRVDVSGCALGGVVLAPRQLNITNCTLSTPSVSTSPPTLNLNSLFPTKLAVTNCVFNGGGGRAIPIGAAATLNLLVDGVAVTVSGNAVVLQDITVDTNQRFLRATASGGSIGYIPAGSSTEQTGTIASIVGAGPGGAVTLNVSLGATIVVGDTLVIHAVQHGDAVVNGATYNNYGGAPVLP